MRCCQGSREIIDRYRWVSAMLCGGKVVDFVDMAGIFANFASVCGLERGVAGEGVVPEFICFM